MNMVPTPHLERRLHIAMLIDIYTPVRNGMVISTQRFVEQLRQRGHRVTVVATAGDQDGRIEAPFFKFPWIDKRYVAPLQFRFAWPQPQTLKDALQDVDCIHIQLPFLLGWWATRYAKKHDIATIATHHLSPQFLAAANVRSPAIVKMFYRLMLQTYNGVDHVICPSQIGLKHLKSFGLKTPASVIGNGVPSHYCPKETPKPTALQNKLFILSVGRFSSEKAHHITLEAIARSKYKKDIHIVLAGEGALEPKLKEQAHRLDISLETELFAPATLLKYYQMADLFIHSSETESEGMVCMEAIGCGLIPIIAEHPLSASSQFALDQRSTYPFGNVQALAKKIDYWFDNPEQRHNMRQNYIDFAKLWSVGSMAEKLEKTYDQIVTMHQASKAGTTSIQQSIAT